MAWLWAASSLLLLAQAAFPEAEAPPRDQEAWDYLRRRFDEKQGEIAKQLDIDAEGGRVRVRGLIVETLKIVVALRGSLLSLYRGEVYEQNAMNVELKLGGLMGCFKPAGTRTIWPPEDFVENPEECIEAFAAYEALLHILHELGGHRHYFCTCKSHSFCLSAEQLERFEALYQATGELLRATFRLRALSIFRCPHSVADLVILPQLELLPRPLLAQLVNTAYVAYTDYMRVLEVASIHELPMSLPMLQTCLRGVEISKILLTQLNRLGERTAVIMYDDDWSEEGERGPGQGFLSLTRSFAAKVANDLICGRQADTAILAVRSCLKTCSPSFNTEGILRSLKTSTASWRQYEGLPSDLGNFALLSRLTQFAQLGEGDWIYTLAGLANVPKWSPRMSKIARVLKRKQILDECFRKISEMQNAEDRRYYFVIYVEYGLLPSLWGRIIGENWPTAYKLASCALAPLQRNTNLPSRADAKSVPDPVDAGEGLDLISRTKKAE